MSAEHGIGRFELEELDHYRSSVELDMMCAIDPLNLMSPGKIIRV